VQSDLGLVVHRHLVMFTALFKKPEPAPAPVFVKIRHLHPEDSRNPRKGKEHDADQGPVPQTLQRIGRNGIAIEGVLRYRERCLEFSKAKRLLRTQLNFFRSGAEDYAGISQQEAFQKLVVRAEGIISDLQESSIGVLTRVESDQPHVKQQPGP
jgi:hypothetical protein